MPKSLNNDIMGVLRQFEIAGEMSSRRSILYAKEIESTNTRRVIKFIFEKTRYYILFDEMIDDDGEYAKEIIQQDDPSVTGRLVRNPHDERSTYGLRFKGKDVYLFEVTPQKSRLDLELTKRFPELSRSTLQKYIKAGYVTINDVVAERAKDEVRDTDDIAIHPPEKTDFSERELPIIYIDDQVIVVNKPAGVLTHSKGAMNDEFTVADFFRRYTTNALDTSRPGIVHRLDRDTSGVIIGARDDETALYLKRQFSDRRVKKHYVAIVEGVPKVEKAVIDLPIGRNPSAPSIFRVDAGGKPALTTYEVLASDSKHSLVKLLPKTGRTHQLRVHMQYINTPILGDRVYGTQKEGERLFLHALELDITTSPGKTHVFTAPLPPDFTHRFKGVKV